MAQSWHFMCVYVCEHIHMYFYKFIHIYLQRSLLNHPRKSLKQTLSNINTFYLDFMMLYDLCQFYLSY